MTSQRHKALALYKRVLRCHYALPPDMKNLGDVYVKVEFRQHKNAKKEFIPQFMQEWTKYCEVWDEFLVSYKNTVEHLSLEVIFSC